MNERLSRKGTRGAPGKPSDLTVLVCLFNKHFLKEGQAEEQAACLTEKSLLCLCADLAHLARYITEVKTRS